MTSQVSASPLIISDNVVKGYPVGKGFVEIVHGISMGVAAGEMVAIIGKRGRHFCKDAALDHVAGYSIFNDGSLRDYQFKSPQWTVGKNFDNTGAFGPHVVSVDELPAGAKGLRIQTRLNGRIMQDANTQ